MKLWLTLIGLKRAYSTLGHVCNNSFELISPTRSFSMVWRWELLPIVCWCPQSSRNQLKFRIWNRTAWQRYWKELVGPCSSPGSWRSGINTWLSQDMCWSHRAFVGHVSKLQGLIWWNHLYLQVWHRNWSFDEVGLLQGWWLWTYGCHPDECQGWWCWTVRGPSYF